MNWAPPSAEPRTHTSAPEPPPPAPETDAERRGLSAVPAAAWIALLGSSLIVVAAIAVVASNWSTIGQSFRVAGLAVVTGGFLVAATRLRAAVPTTASIVAHVGTYLTPFVAIAVMSLFGFTWPACLTIGGLVLIGVTHVQAQQWRRLTMHLAQVAGFAVASTGVAALTGTTAGIIAAIASVVLLVLGAQRRSVALSLLAVLSPVLSALADLGIGSGALRRAGLVGEQLSWSGPAVGIIAATIIGAVALDRRNNPLMLIAAASPVLGVVTGLSAIDGSAVAWWTVPALAVIAAELGWWLLPADHTRRAIGEYVTVLSGIVTALAWFSPILVQFDLFAVQLATPWAIPTTVTGIAVALATLRWKRDDSLAADLGIAAVAATVVATLFAFDVPSLAIAVVAFGLTIAAAALSRRLGPLAIHATAWWGVAAVVDTAPDSTVHITATLTVLAALVAAVTVIRARLAASSSWLGWFEMSVVTAAAVGAAVVTVPAHGPATAVLGAAAVAVLAAVVDRRLTTWAVIVIGATGALALDAATSTLPIDATYWLGWAGATALLVALWVVHRSPIASFAAAAAGVITAATAAGAVGATAEDFVVMAMLAVAALTGIAVTVQRRSPLDAAAATAGVMLLAGTTFPIDPVWVSGIWLVLGLQAAAYGVTARLDALRLGGVGVAAAATGSWFFTTGLDDWFLRVIEPADIRVVDLWLAAVTVMALVAGLALRATLQVNSWVAYSATLVVSSLWLIPVHVERSTVWALPLLLTIGVVATAIGAWQRLAALLVGGTLVTAIGAFLATGSDLTAVPTWVWLALGGSLLLGTAVLIERSGRPGSADLRDLVSRWN